jgi:dienelactone hydrolase
MKNMQLRLVLLTLMYGFSAHARTVKLTFTNEQNQPVDELLVGERANIHISGLDAGASVTVRCGQGELTSLARFTASPSGTVELEDQAPDSGTYSGADPDGMWWSRDVGVGPSIGTPQDAFSCIVQHNSQTIASGALRRISKAVGVKSQTLTFASEGLVGQFSLPPGSGPFPALLFLGGSEGGFSAGASDYFASKGYATLSLAYFAAPGLADNLDRIPIEYFEKAINWMRDQPIIDSSHFAVFGTSRGGELALLLASRLNVFSAVISVVGSPVVWAGGYDEVAKRQTSSWTIKGREIPFVSFPDAAPVQIKLPDGRMATDNAAAFAAAMRKSEEVSKAFIPIEQIKSPILFLGGADDHIWPSCEFGQLLSDRRHSPEDSVKCFIDAGHWIGNPGYPTTDLTFVHPVFHDLEFFGGTPSGTAHAQREGWQLVLSFLSSTTKDR